MASQFDVFHHPAKNRRVVYPYLIVLQHDEVASASDVIVAPLAPLLHGTASRLQPVLDVNGQPLLLLTQFLGAVPRRLLRRPVVTLEHNRNRIIAAVDMLFAGS